MAHTLRVRGPAFGNNVTVELDGHDISNYLQGLEVRMEVGKLNEVYLTLALTNAPIDLGIEVEKVTVLSFERSDPPPKRWWRR